MQIRQTSNIFRRRRLISALQADYRDEQQKQRDDGEKKEYVISVGLHCSAPSGCNLSIDAPAHAGAADNSAACFRE
jgi:hypothetical protein